jgi:arabinan endo-1,5-alpha-L-arabinosidase
MRRSIAILATLVSVSWLTVVGAAFAASAPQAGTFKPDQDGFIQNWLVLDPIRLTGIQHTEQGIKSIVSRDSFKDLLTASPKAGDSVSIEGANYVWQVVSTRGYVIDLTGYAAKQNKPVLNVIFWGIAYVTSSEEVKDARLAIGSDDSSVWWVNGKEVIGAYGVRQTATDDNVSKRLTLNKGVNVVRFAVIQGDGPGDCCVRFYDARQKPISNLSISLVPPTASLQAQPAAEPNAPTAAQPSARRGGRAVRAPGPINLADMRIRDICILPDPATKTYYMVGPGGRGIVQYTSKDLKVWEGPRPIYTPEPNVWGNIRTGGIWAPEIHKYKGKYYLFFTFNSGTPLPDPNPSTKPPLSQRPLVYRGSTIAVSDSPTGPFTVMQNHAIPPSDMMTLDGTLFVEDGQPYMVFAHEWVQITTGTIEAIKLKDDLSTAIDKPFLIFKSSDAPWAKVQPEGCIVTDGPFFRKSKSGKLFMVWSSFDGQQRYNVGLAISASGRLAGPWTHQAEALFVDNGGHPMVFETFEGKLMLVFHWPNGPAAQPRIFELEDTGETLKVLNEFTGNP